MNSIRSLSKHSLLFAFPFLAVAACGGNPEVREQDDDVPGGFDGGVMPGPVMDGGGVGPGPGPILSDDDVEPPPEVCNPNTGENCDPDDFVLVDAGPACGDGMVDRGEECDDGNSIPGDGCNGACQEEPYYVCDEPGKPCTFTIECGDGQVDPGEVCDDGNTEEGDGCSATCEQDPDYICTAPNEPCELVYLCGDGVVNGSENCDDGNADPDDGCDADCQTEDGYVCATPGSDCAVIEYCGDGVQQTGEACDDGDVLRDDPVVWSDGCSGVCTVDPFYSCPTPGEACMSLIICGDGIRHPGEACDDGNTDDADGCSADCTAVDPGYVCPPEVACVQLYSCGDGRVSGATGETCDDGDTDSMDGCSSTCQIESGWTCPAPGQPCQVVTFCGDGTRQGSEQCDDGNNDPGDGCSAQCRIETDWICDVNGQNCTYNVACGDGVVNGDEACDTGTAPSVGCIDCTAVDDGYTCPRGGFACRTVCGDGIIAGTEQCDDSGVAPGDGCDAYCRVEPNTVCTGEPSTCTDTVCGDAAGQQGTEPCDDGNNDWGDGCTPACQKEPTCPIDGPCTSACGDGIKFPTEECDDGNTQSGDGCSSTCEEEDGYDCQIEDIDLTQLDLPIVYRDFVAGAPYGAGHTDFEWDWADWCPPGDGGCAGGGNFEDADSNLGNNGGLANVYQQGSDMWGLVQDFVRPTLGGAADGALLGKPVFAFADPDGGGDCPLAVGALRRNSQGFCAPMVRNASSFGQWFRDVAGVNTPVLATLVLAETGTNTFAFDSETTQADGVAYPGGTPANARGFWPLESLGTTGTQCNGTTARNFHFTSETHHWFQFDASSPPTLTFTGDDDVFVFIGGSLALDLGGVHGRLQGEVAINAAGNATTTITDPGNGNAVLDTATPALGLVDAGIYEVVVFQAERNQCESNYRLELENFNLQKSVCTPICGDGVITAEEECDDAGDNTSTPTYDSCTQGACPGPNCCTLGPFCGDDIVTAPQETCDNADNRDGWGDTGMNLCAPGCQPVPECGDGNVDSPYEECDDGVANTDTGYNGCTTSCQLGPYCGDGAVNGAETCDDGINDGRYGGCTPECAPAPRCGDDVVQADWGEECDSPTNCTALCRLVCGNGVVDDGEECDDGVNDGSYSYCAPGCVWGPRCGDGTVDEPFETCDEGPTGNDGGYDECSPFCQPDEYCGDGIVNGDEQCDNRINSGGYNACAPGCVLGPRCGDGMVQAEWGEQCDGGANCAENCRLVGSCGDGVVQENLGEECDDGVNDGGWGECGPMCMEGPRCGDGVVQPEDEQCDDGDNDGGYGECAVGCRFGPRCGDGKVNGPEQCDDGNKTAGDGCSSTCLRERMAGAR